MRKSFWIIGTLLVIFVMVLSACQPAAPVTEAPAAEEPAAEEPVAPAEADAFKVALLLPGSANDQSWNQLAYDGVMKAKDALGIEVAYSENVDQNTQVDAIRDYAEQGYDVIIGHSGSYEEAMATLGPEYPDTHMVVIAGSKGGGDNVTAVDTAPWQVGYSEGYLAGKTTKVKQSCFHHCRGRYAGNEQLRWWMERRCQSCQPRCGSLCGLCVRLGRCCRRP